MCVRVHESDSSICKQGEMNNECEGVELIPGVGLFLRPEPPFKEHQ